MERAPSGSTNHTSPSPSYSQHHRGTSHGSLNASIPPAYSPQSLDRAQTSPGAQVAQSKPCKYFKKGQCKNEQCPYLHEYCRFYAQGCANGDACPYRHMPPESTVPDPLAPTSREKAYAIDCEFIQVRQGKGPEARQFPVTVSVGIVSQTLETILYARVKQPPRTQVFDDSFARVVSHLDGDWSTGIRVDVARGLVQDVLDEGCTMVGWQIDSDFKGLRLEQLMAERRHQIEDMSEQFMTTNGNKCQLSEAYQYIFQRPAVAHDACDDAKMTMELWHHWRRSGKRQCFLPLQWYQVKWQCSGSSPAEDFASFRWNILRPEKSDRSTCIEEKQSDVPVPMDRRASAGEDFGVFGLEHSCYVYQLRFRQNDERTRYFNLVKQRMIAAGTMEDVLPVPCAEGHQYLFSDFCLATLTQEPR